MRIRAGGRARLRTRRSCAWPGRCRGGRARTRPPSSRARRGARRGEIRRRPPPAPRRRGARSQIVLDQLEGRIRPCRLDGRLLAVAGVVVREGVDADDLAPLGEQRVDQRGSDESRTARDQVARHRRNDSQWPSTRSPRLFENRSPTSRRGAQAASQARPGAKTSTARPAAEAALARLGRVSLFDHLREPLAVSVAVHHQPATGSGQCVHRVELQLRAVASKLLRRGLDPPRPGGSRRRADQGRSASRRANRSSITSRPWRSPSWTSDSSKISSL